MLIAALKMRCIACERAAASRIKPGAVDRLRCLLRDRWRAVFKDGHGGFTIYGGRSLASVGKRWKAKIIVGAAFYLIYE